MNHGVRIRRSRFESSVPPPPPLPTSSIAAIALSRSRRSDDEIRALQQVNEDRDHLLCDFEEKKRRMCPSTTVLGVWSVLTARAVFKPRVCGDFVVVHSLYLLSSATITYTEPILRRRDSLLLNVLSCSSRRYTMDHRCWKCIFMFFVWHPLCLRYGNYNFRLSKYSAWYRGTKKRMIASLNFQNVPSVNYRATKFIDFFTFESRFNNLEWTFSNVQCPESFEMS